MNLLNVQVHQQKHGQAIADAEVCRSVRAGSTVRRMSTGWLQKAPPGAPARRWILCAVVGLLTVLSACGTAPGNRPAAGTPAAAARASAAAPGTTIFAVNERRPVPAVSGQTLSGGALALHDLIGADGVVVVNVWASWCAPCREEAAVLAGAARELSGQRVEFVGVDEADSAAAARQFVAQSGLPYPQLLDPDGAILARLSVLPASGIPSTLVIDGRGYMAARVIGPLTSTSLHRVVAAARGDA